MLLSLQGPALGSPLDAPSIAAAAPQPLCEEMAAEEEQGEASGMEGLLQEQMRELKAVHEARMRSMQAIIEVILPARVHGERAGAGGLAPVGSLVLTRSRTQSWS